MTSSRDDAPRPSSERLERRLRLRRLRFPRIRPRGGPHGYVDGLGWLAEGLLWIDGWLTLAPVDRFEVAFEIAGTPIRRTAACFTYPRANQQPPSAHRRWILAVPVGPGFETASRVRRIALTTPWGDLLWSGGYDRFITPDVIDRLQHPTLSPHLLSRLEPFLEAVVRGHGADPGDPTFRRTLKALRRRLELNADPKPRLDAHRRGCHVEETVACPGGLLYFSVLLENRDRVSLVARAAREPRAAETAPAPGERNGTGLTPPDFLTAIAVAAGGSPGTVRYCHHGEAEGVAWKPIRKARMSALELREHLIERLGAESSLPPRAIELLHAVSLAAHAEGEVDRVRVVGEPPARPAVSVVVTMARPDLLDHHLLHLRRSLAADRHELILVVGPSAAAAADDLVPRLEGLSELYDVAVTVVLLARDTTCSAAAEIGARRARGDLLLMVHGHCLGFSPAGIPMLVEPFERNPSVGITAPTIVHFDGAMRSAGLRIVDLGQAGTGAIRPMSVLNGNGGSSQPVRIDACSADCFAIRRQLFSALGGFAGLFLDDDFEAIDLCLRAAAAGFDTLRVPATFTRLVGEDFRGFAQPRTLARRHDLETLSRRHRDRVPRRGVEPFPGVAAAGHERPAATAEPMVAGVERLVR